MLHTSSKHNVSLLLYNNISLEPLYEEGNKTTKQNNFVLFLNFDIQTFKVNNGGKKSSR